MILPDLDISRLYWKQVNELIDERGIYPHLVVWIDKNNLPQSTRFYENGFDLLRTIKKQILSKSPIAVAFGQDRKTRINQDTKYKDCLPVAFLIDNGWKIGVLNYKPKPNNVLDNYDWSNRMWSMKIIKELSAIGLVAGIEISPSSLPDTPHSKTKKLVSEYSKLVKEYGWDSDYANGFIFSNNHDEQFVVLANLYKNFERRLSLGEIDPDDILGIGGE